MPTTERPAGSASVTNYATQKGQEALDNVRGVGDTFANALDKSLKERPYTTLALALAGGFVFGAIWRG
jgi:hypothetical protein